MSASKDCSPAPHGPAPPHRHLYLGSPGCVLPPNHRMQGLQFTPFRETNRTQQSSQELGVFYSLPFILTGAMALRADDKLGCADGTGGW